MESHLFLDGREISYLTDKAARRAHRRNLSRWQRVRWSVARWIAP